jgi:predicted dehydrogenase
MRILIAGLGAIGQRHARNLRALYGDDLELLAYRQRRLAHVVTESLQRDDSLQVEAELGVRSFSDLSEALAQAPQAVFVCTPSSQHVAIALRAAEAGCHLFIEKPVSHALKDLERLREIVDRRRLVVLVGCQWRYHPCVKWLARLIETEALGRLSHATIEYAEFLPDWHPYEDYRQSYAARAALGGGVVLTQIHDYDLAWRLFGPPRRISATGGHLSALEIDVEDTVDARLEGGCAPVRVRQTFAGGPARRTITVAGENGTAIVDLLGATASVDSKSPVDFNIGGYERNQMFVDELCHFQRCLSGLDRPAVPLREGIEVLRVAIAVKDAMRTGQQVELA